MSERRPWPECYSYYDGEEESITALDEVQLKRLIKEIDGVFACIDLDMSGDDPGVGKVLPLPLTHKQLRYMAELLLNRTGLHQAEIEAKCAEVQELLRVVGNKVRAFSTPP